MPNPFLDLSSISGSGHPKLSSTDNVAAPEGSESFESVAARVESAENPKVDSDEDQVAEHGSGMQVATPGESVTNSHLVSEPPFAVESEVAEIGDALAENAEHISGDVEFSNRAMQWQVANDDVGSVGGTLPTAHELSNQSVVQQSVTGTSSGFNEAFSSGESDLETGRPRVDSIQAAVAGDGSSEADATVDGSTASQQSDEATIGSELDSGLTSSRSVNAIAQPVSNGHGDPAEPVSPNQDLAKAGRIKTDGESDVDSKSNSGIVESVDANGSDAESIAGIAPESTAAMEAGHSASDRQDDLPNVRATDDSAGFVSNATTIDHLPRTQASESAAATTETDGPRDVIERMSGSEVQGRAGMEATSASTPRYQNGSEPSNSRDTAGDADPTNPGVEVSAPSSANDGDDLLGDGDTAESSQSSDVISREPAEQDLEAGAELEGLVDGSVDASDGPAAANTPAAADSSHVFSEKQVHESTVESSGNLGGSDTPRLTPEIAGGNSWVTEQSVEQTATDSEIVETMSLEALLNDDPQPESIKKPVESIRDAMATSLQREGKTVEIELHPAELGRLKIQVTQVDQAIDARIVATEFMTSELLNGHRDQLLESLAELGFDASDVDISHEQGESGQNAGEQDSPSFTYQSKSKTPAGTIRTTNPSGGVNIVA